METFYHGSGNRFEKFDLENNVLKGDGKIKFGYGVYVTSKFESARHYSAANKESTKHYVYTLEIPDKTDKNYIAFKEPVKYDIINSVQNKLNVVIPEKACADGKEFRKYLVEYFGGRGKNQDKLKGEKMAAQLLCSVGVIYICWPYNWKNPLAGDNRAVLDDSFVKIIKCEEVTVDEK